MKLKNIIIVSLLLAIFAIGAVSASEDIASDETLAVEDGIDDSIQEIDDSVLENDDSNLEDNDETLAADDSDSESETLEQTDKDVVGFTAEWHSGENLDYDYGVFTFKNDHIETGFLTVFVNENQAYTREITQNDYDADKKCAIPIKAYMLGIKSPSTYNIKVRFNDNPDQSSNVVIRDYTFYCSDEWNNPLEQGYYGYGETMNIYVHLPKDATGRATLKINGKSYTVDYINGLGQVSVSTTGWRLGIYQLEVTYNGNSKYNQRTLDDEWLSIQPNYIAPELMSVNENRKLEFSATPGLDGNVKLEVYKYNALIKDWDRIVQRNINVANGYASYSLANLEEGLYNFFFDYTIGGYSNNNNDDPLVLSVMRNNNKFSSSITPTEITVGQNVDVKLTGPKLKQSFAEIYVDNEYLKGVVLKTGQINEIIYGLTEGTHIINVQLYSDWEDDGLTYFYSITKTIKVNPKPTTLTLNTVTIKKSAKSLTLSATLKVKGVAKSGIAVKFKFNGKTYTAKTNAKGVAKYTISKAILKKLKVGKTIAYQASYGSKTVKKTAKVRK